MTVSLYEGKTILAPMVRVGNVAFRVFCASRGADVVFSEEVVAAKLCRCHPEVRMYNAEAGTMIEFIVYEAFKHQFKRSVVFSTPQRSTTNPMPEGAPVVIQLGVSNPHVGAAAALLCCEYVDGIDINMGCPKKFSVSNGMGAALMMDSGRAAAIIAAIDTEVNAHDRVSARGRRVPISFKTRLLETADETARMILNIMKAVGPGRVHAITLHARTRDQDSDTPPHYDRAAATVRELRMYPLFKDVCFVLNGSVTSRANSVEKMKLYGFDGAMIARQAMWDMTVFSQRPRKEESESVSSPSLPAPYDAESWLALYRDLLRCHARYNVPFMYVKYHLTRSFPFIEAMKGLMKAVQQGANSYEDVAKVYGLSIEEQNAMRCLADPELVSIIPDSENTGTELSHFMGTKIKETELSKRSSSEPALQRIRTDGSVNEAHEKNGVKAEKN